VDAEGEQRLGKPQIEISQPQILPATTQGGNKPLPKFDRNRIINESKGLMIIGDMGAAKTCVAQHIANGFDGYGIIVFDPHGKTDWGNAYVITKMGLFTSRWLSCLTCWRMATNHRCWSSAMNGWRFEAIAEQERRRVPGLADDFIRLFSTKPRKFNKLAAFVLHSPNVEAAGVDSFLRENYLKVYLGRLAVKGVSTHPGLCLPLCAGR
jgi:hypothetical protein